MKELRRVVILAVMLCFASAANAQNKQNDMDSVKEGIGQMFQSMHSKSRIILEKDVN